MSSGQKSAYERLEEMRHQERKAKLKGNEDFVLERIENARNALNYFNESDPLLSRRQRDLLDAALTALSKLP